MPLGGPRAHGSAGDASNSFLKAHHLAPFLVVHSYIPVHVYGAQSEDAVLNQPLNVAMSSYQAPLDKSGFDLHADQRGRIIASLTSIIVVTTVIVALRLLSRKVARAGFWWDDYIAIVAWAFALIACVLWLKALDYGFGRHIYIWGEEEGRKKAREWLKILYTFEFFFHTGTTLAKYSILAFYYRIFKVRSFRRLLVWVAVLCTCNVIAVDLTVIFQCHPIHHAWNRPVDGSNGHCINEDRFFIGSGSVNVFLNALVFILPMPLLWRLRTTVRQQIILTAIFTLAGFVVLISIIWIVVLARLESEDVTWNFINAGIWSSLEPSMAVVCACIPSLRPLYSMTVHGLHHACSVSKTKLSSTTGRRTWPVSRNKSSNGVFSQLDEQPDDVKPLGHEVSVHGYMGADPESISIELPTHGIHVKTEIKVSTEGLEYQDRLF